MSKLSKNWITEKHIDFEYKKYVLLAYLQEVEKHFELSRLYPSLAEVIEHYRAAKAILENRDMISDAFPKRIKGLSADEIRLKYEAVLKDDALMEEITSILEYSIPRFKETAEEGKKIYEFVEEHMNLFPVGLIPLDNMEGYLFLKGGNSPRAHVYEYKVTLFEQPDEKYRAIHTTFLTDFNLGLATTFETIKTRLIREKREKPNPAAFAVESEMDFPLTETFLPIAKRMLVRHIAGRL
jgi:hypothetical protein